MHRDQSPLRARSAPDLVPPLFLDVDHMVDEFTRLPMRAKFGFDPELAAVITVEFLSEHGPGPVWNIGRELLKLGVTSMSGSGDVRMWPTLRADRPSSWLLLESREVEALFEVPTERLAEWLDATCRAVPTEREMAALDWDGFLRDVLGGPEPHPA
ncbi:MULTISPECIES: SsgA family sporulation/cell division regulator [unclassified Streptomyces]|uniref:SsgA family sporulation/cell division regulator n=1 Tax=unclassified Streptomyces TaxID=2593676 RepID=UPI002E296A10|nr:SsgA family sporulation/cell division regulator [Streptomyces sp. NBC_01423]WSX95575.1 SsgA family sporulation/cell division regulator [Streptomyces sp. NBC_00891]WSY10055.1 SsgA family sporulation/cell division regulator [Streptomyces sp. NBC_00890]WSZ11811.1 SsgA family sporulation/cell division regulator [Streptomyces sp. NBC_00869]WSZ27783.1 SsgA family sporulation/cell division regulator [Streptomyces sp. NBC_00870]